jgi:predicted nucleic acid-binding protein
VSGSSVVVDTNIFVSARNPDEAGYGDCRRLLDRIDSGKPRALVSAITLAEIRSGLEPAEAQAVWQALASHFLTSPNYSVEPVDVAIAERAGELRQQTKLTLPDAIVVATGQLRGATAIVTQDRELGRRQTVVRTCSPSEVG